MPSEKLRKYLDGSIADPDRCFAEVDCRQCKRDGIYARDGLLLCHKHFELLYPGELGDSWDHLSKNEKREHVREKAVLLVAAGRAFEAYEIAGPYMKYLQDDGSLLDEFVGLSERVGIFVFEGACISSPSDYPGAMETELDGVLRSLTEEEQRRLADNEFVFEENFHEFPKEGGDK